MLTRGMEEAVAEANGVMCLVGPAFLLTSFCFLNCRSWEAKKLHFPEFLAARAPQPVRFHHVNTVVGEQESSEAGSSLPRATFLAARMCFCNEQSYK